MAQYIAQTIWERGGEAFVDSRYSRKHIWRFDGGAEIVASSSPHVVPVPLSDVSAVDPEEAFVASLSSCHMLWFLSIAAKRKFCVDRYSDEAVGIMEKNHNGKLAMTVVTLRPKVDFSGPVVPSRDELLEMHHEAHSECFIANSVKSEVRCEPV
jgi:organic hydroperoxide reductase OsmC/OhrA